MLDRLFAYSPCLDVPDQWAIATVVSVSGSVPRPIGTSMAVRSDSLTIGSISGGCVESALVDAALTCIDSGQPTLCDFGYADDDGLSVGLMCGGDIRVFIDPVSTVANALRTLLPVTAPASAGVPVCPARPTDLTGPAAAEPLAPETGSLIRELPYEITLSNGAHIGSSTAPHYGTPAHREESQHHRTVPRLPMPAVAVPTGQLLPAAYAAEIGRAADEVDALIHSGGCGIVEVRDDTVVECPIIRRLFVESHRPRARVLIYGANDFSAAIAEATSFLGLHVTVCDARPAFATQARHPGAHDVIVARPGDHFAEEVTAGRVDARTAVIMLTHDPRFDLPVLDRALRMDLAYVGAMGSRTTHERRAQELLNGGLPAAAFARLHSPIGLDIGARTPPEVAVAVLAEYIACTRRTGYASSIPQLRDTSGPVHADRSGHSSPRRGGPSSSDHRADDSVPHPTMEAASWT
ncbi:XdhC family protein [Brevibacterium sediminis]|uniref:XdhC family protein n=1 Tax=Brevibacterium sediminis TaxID=1857024 RepID=UPI002174F018|nr:XdhC/CoxI family protein [Brevibacterium sediminis]MCS4593872.1 XdhC family protein [Brevibacterium sediminis]